MVSLHHGYVYWFIWGMIGGHRFYFGDRKFGLILLALGLCCYSIALFTPFKLISLFMIAYWGTEFFQIPKLYQRRHPTAKLTANIRIGKGKTLVRSLPKTYNLWFLGGVFGLHRFYLRNPLWGSLYGLLWGVSMFFLISNRYYFDVALFDYLPFYIPVNEMYPLYPLFALLMLWIWDLFLLQFRFIRVPKPELQPT